MAGDETLLEELDRKLAETQATLDLIKRLTAELERITESPLPKVIVIR